MATSGKSRRRLLVLAVGALIASTLGCSANHQASPSQAGGKAPAAAPPSAAEPGPSFCAVANPSSLTQAETVGAITHTTGEDLAPMAVAPDGSSYFALDGHGVSSMHDLVWVRDHGAQRQTVFTLAAPYLRYGPVSFDGRWLIFMADESKDLGGAWDLFAWDTRAGGPPKSIAHDDGTAAGGLVERSEVSAGKATWVQELADGTAQVHLFDLAGGQDKVVHTGHIGSSMFAGGLLAWTEVLQQNGPTTLAAVSVATGQPVSLPAPVAKAQTAPGAIAGDGTTWAWTSADYRTLYAWQPGMADAVAVRAVDESDSVDEPGVSGDVVTWTGATATYAADLKTRSYTQITAQYGSALVNGDAIAVYYPHGDPKSPDMTYDGYVLPQKAVSALTACAV